MQRKIDFREQISNISNYDSTIETGTEIEIQATYGEEEKE